MLVDDDIILLIYFRALFWNNDSKWRVVNGLRRAGGDWSGTSMI